ncbi:transcriptional regulator [Pseudaquabacterium rugosum]|jgi:hypothetical protein|uniref:YdaS family helix-turn-helix protein n=1 Tax=Pseudaquabacterium rugosum TaxID=2984194 RepID=A0ABU9B5Z7_9BURK
MTNLIDDLGGVAAVARMAGVRMPTVSGWRGRIPALRCPAIERESGTPVEELRPDVTWARIPDPTWPHPDGRPCIDVAGPPAQLESSNAK